MISPKLARVGDAIEFARTATAQVVRVLQLTLSSRANGSQSASRQGCWARAKTYRAQRTVARAVLTGAGVGDALGRWGWACLVVRLVRVSPGELDDDNAVAAAKNVRDGVADALGVDDRDPRVVWLPVDQEIGRPCVKVELYRWDAGVASMPASGATKRPRPRSRHGPDDIAPSGTMTKMSQSKFKP